MITDAVRDILLKDIHVYITTNRKIDPVPKVEDLDALIAKETNVTTKTVLLLLKQCHNKTMHPTHFFQTLRHTLDEYDGGSLAGVKEFFGYERSHLKSILSQTLVSAEDCHGKLIEGICGNPDYKVTNERVFQIACKLARRDMQVSYMMEKLEFDDKYYAFSNSQYPSDYLCGGTLRYGNLKSIQSPLIMKVLEGYVAAHEFAYTKTQAIKRDDVTVYSAFETNAKREFEDEFVMEFDVKQAVFPPNPKLPAKVSLTDEVKEFMKCELVSLSCRNALKDKINTAHSSNVAIFLKGRNAGLRKKLADSKQVAADLHEKNDELSHELEGMMAQSKTTPVEDEEAQSQDEVEQASQLGLN